MNARGTWKRLEKSFDETLAALPAALAQEGFGILTQIDVQETLKKKLDVDFRRYRIVGACNPKLAHEALSKDPTVGVLLPCNVILYEEPDGKAVLGVVDPVASIGGDPEFLAFAEAVRDKLGRVAASLP
jgi:uncharacterized protein (DUF302 family)